MFYLSLWVSKLYLLFTKKKNNDRAGSLALKLDKNFYNHVRKPKIIIGVTGTNGKTTTCNFLVDILQANNYKVTSNKEGANFLPGIAKALLNGVNIFNKSKVDIAVIEFDELGSKKVLPYLKPNYIAVTNLFSDTMKRNAHTDYVFNKIQEGLRKGSILFFNAHDLISSQLGKKNKKIYFGISKLKDDKKVNLSQVQDIRVCPKCYIPLKFAYFHYHHLGKAKCPQCGFTNPHPQYQLTNIDYDKRQLTINNEKYFLVNDGLFNIYNELLTISILKEMGIKNINESLKKLEIVKTRFQKIKIKNLEIISQMAKGQNPIAVSRALDYVKKLSGKKELIIMLDDIYDNKASNHSEVMSWLYDSDFENLNDVSIKKIIIGGFRSCDYKVRMLLAGIDAKKIFTSQEEINTYKYLDLKNTDKVIIIHDIYLNKTANDIISKIEDALR